MSPRRASLPPPLPPLRARPNSPLRFRSGRDRPVSSLPPPTPGGGKITIARPLVPPAAPSPPLPPLAPARSRPFAFARVVPGQTARCPLPLPAGALNHISSHHWSQLLCVRPTLTRTIFFPLLGHSPGPMPRYASAWAQASALAKVFRLAHTIKAIVNNT